MMGLSFEWNFKVKVIDVFKAGEPPFWNSEDPELTHYNVVLIVRQKMEKLISLLEDFLKIRK